MAQRSLGAHFQQKAAVLRHVVHVFCVRLNDSQLEGHAPRFDSRGDAHAPHSLASLRRFTRGLVSSLPSSVKSSPVGAALTSEAVPLRYNRFTAHSPASVRAPSPAAAFDTGNVDNGSATPLQGVVSGGEIDALTRRLAAHRRVEAMLQDQHYAAAAAVSLPRLGVDAILPYHYDESFPAPDAAARINDKHVSEALTVAPRASSPSSLRTSALHAAQTLHMQLQQRQAHARESAPSPPRPQSVICSVQVQAAQSVVSTPYTVPRPHNPPSFQALPEPLPPPNQPPLGNSPPLVPRPSRPVPSAAAAGAPPLVRPGPVAPVATLTLAAAAPTVPASAGGDKEKAGPPVARESPTLPPIQEASALEGGDQSICDSSIDAGHVNPAHAEAAAAGFNMEPATESSQVPGAVTAAAHVIVADEGQGQGLAASATSNAALLRCGISRALLAAVERAAVPNPSTVRLPSRPPPPPPPAGELAGQASAARVRLHVLLRSQSDVAAAAAAVAAVAATATRHAGSTTQQLESPWRSPATARSSLVARSTPAGSSSLLHMSASASSALQLQHRLSLTGRETASDRVSLRQRRHSVSFARGSGGVSGSGGEADVLPLGARASASSAALPPHGISASCGARGVAASTVTLRRPESPSLPLGLSGSFCGTTSTGTGLWSRSLSQSQRRGSRAGVADDGALASKFSAAQRLLDAAISRLTAAQEHERQRRSLSVPRRRGSLSSLPWTAAGGTAQLAMSYSGDSISKSPHAAVALDGVHKQDAHDGASGRAQRMGLMADALLGDDGRSVGPGLVRRRQLEQAASPRGPQRRSSSAPHRSGRHRAPSDHSHPLPPPVYSSSFAARALQSRTSSPAPSPSPPLPHGRGRAGNPARGGAASLRRSPSPPPCVSANPPGEEDEIREVVGQAYPGPDDGAAAAGAAVVDDGDGRSALDCMLYADEGEARGEARGEATAGPRDEEVDEEATAGADASALSNLVPQALLFNTTQLSGVLEAAAPPANDKLARVRSLTCDEGAAFLAVRRLADAASTPTVTIGLDGIGFGGRGGGSLQTPRWPPPLRMYWARSGPAPLPPHVPVSKASLRWHYRSPRAAPVRRLLSVNAAVLRRLFNLYARIPALACGLCGSTVPSPAAAPSPSTSATLAGRAGSSRAGAVTGAGDRDGSGRVSARSSSRSVALARAPRPHAAPSTMMPTGGPAPTPVLTRGRGVAALRSKSPQAGAELLRDGADPQRLGSGGMVDITAMPPASALRQRQLMTGAVVGLLPESTAGQRGLAALPSLWPHERSLPFHQQMTIPATQPVHYAGNTSAALLWAAAPIEARFAAAVSRCPSCFGTLKQPQEQQLGDEDEGRKGEVAFDTLTSAPQVRHSASPTAPHVPTHFAGSVAAVAIASVALDYVGVLAFARDWGVLGVVADAAHLAVLVAAVSSSVAEEEGEGEKGLRDEELEVDDVPPSSAATRSSGPVAVPSAAPHPPPAAVASGALLTFPDFELLLLAVSLTSRFCLRRRTSAPPRSVHTADGATVASQHLDASAVEALLEVMETSNGRVRAGSYSRAGIPPFKLQLVAS